MHTNDNIVIKYLLSRLDRLSNEKISLSAGRDGATYEEVNKDIEIIEAEEKEIREAIKSIQRNEIENSKKDKISADNYGIKILEQQEEERQRIARELHDSTVQVLTNLVHKTELCTKIMDFDLIRAKLELEIINNSLRYTINDMRNIIHDLRPMAFDDFGLDTTLERVVSQIKQNTDIQICLSIIGEKQPLPPVFSLTLLRIMQEACNNSIRHSEAENINIIFEYQSNMIRLSVKDDGKGFSVKETEKKKGSEANNTGFGLSIMKERATLLSGACRIVSNKNTGTNVIVEVPIV